MIRVVFTLLVALISGCSANHSAMPDGYTGRQVAVGSGGGFTGLTTTYYVLDNRKLFRKSNRDTVYTPLGKLTARQKKRVFSAILDTCQIAKTPYNEPGNVSRFVLFQDGAESHRVTWAVGDSAVPTSYSKFYQSFMAIVPVPDQSN